MSIPASKRNQGEMVVITKARLLREYTIKTCTNENHFPKRYRWCITKNIIDNCNQVVDLILAANEVKVEHLSDKLRRLERQKTALELTAVLLDNINVAYDVFHFKIKTLDEWTRRITDIQNLLRAWIRSDSTRYINI